MTSKKISDICLATSSVRVLFNATIPPKALVLSVLNAFSQAFVIFLFCETPHGLACLIMATAGSLNSFTNSKAASASLKLLYDNSLPWI